jgi:hypothetical protein
MANGERAHQWKLHLFTLYVHPAREEEVTNDQVIFAFYWTLFQAQGRMKSGLHSKLRFSSILTLRILLPIAAYFFLVRDQPLSRETLRLIRSHYGSHVLKLSGKSQCRITLVELVSLLCGH